MGVVVTRALLIKDLIIIIGFMQCLLLGCGDLDWKSQHLSFCDVTYMLHYVYENGTRHFRENKTWQSLGNCDDPVWSGLHRSLPAPDSERSLSLVWALLHFLVKKRWNTALAWQGMLTLSAKITLCRQQFK